MKGKATKVADKQKIIKAKLTNPELSLRDIQKLTGTNHKTVGDIINKVPQVVTSSNEALNMVDKLDDIINDIVFITKKNILKYKDREDELQTRELRDLSAIAKENFERKQILTGQPTDITKVDFNLEGKSIKELEELRKSILSSKNK